MYTVLQLHEHHEDSAESDTEGNRRLRPGTRPFLPKPALITQSSCGRGTRGNGIHSFIAMTVTVTETSTGNIEWLPREFNAVPSAVRRRMEVAKGPAILCSASSPYNIIATNELWRKLCGFGSEALGKCPSILQGELTDMKKAAKFRRDLTDDGVSRTMLANYKKSGEAFVHHLRATKMNGGHGCEYYLTESYEVTDESFRRAVLKPPEASTVVEQCVSVAIALSLTYLAIVCLSSHGLSGVPPTHGPSVAGSLGGKDEFEAFIACSLVAVLVATIISATESVEGGRRMWRASKGDPNAAIAFVMTVGLLLVSLEARPQAIACVAVGSIGAVRAICFPSVTAPSKWPRHTSSTPWSKGLAEVLLVTGLALGVSLSTGGLVPFSVLADPPTQASFTPFAPWELNP